MLYDAYNNATIHLGIEELNEDVGHYVARTFLIEKNKGDKFIKDQTPLDIKSVYITPKTDKEVMEQTASGSLR